MKIKKITGNMMLRFPLLCYLLLIFTCNIAKGQLQFAELGDFTLQNEQIIKDCKINYRTFGQLNVQQSNAILFPTYYGGTLAWTQYLSVSRRTGTIKKYFILIY